MRERDYGTALLRFSSAVSADERDPRIWLDYGAALLGNQDYRRSIEILEKALALVEGDGGDGFSIPKGDLAMLYNNLGLAHEQLKELELAESHFLSAIRTSHPDSTERTMATNNLLAFLVRTGAAYEASNQLAAAASYFRKGLDLAPNSVLLLNNLAVVYRREGRHTEAIELVKRSLEIREDPSTLRMLDVLSQEAGVQER